MSNARDHHLAHLAHRASARTDNPAEVNQAVADQLRVPVDAYRTYLLVAQAIDTHLHYAHRELGDQQPAGDRQPVARLAELTNDIGYAASTIYHDTAVGDGHSDVHDAAGDILRSVAHMHATVRDLALQPALGDGVTVAASHADRPSLEWELG